MNGCGGPGTELVDKVVTFIADVALYGILPLLEGEGAPVVAPAVPTGILGVVPLILGANVPD